MLNRISLQTIRTHKQILIIIFFMLLLVVLAWWVSERLIKHIDHHMPGF